MLGYEFLVKSSQIFKTSPESSKFPCVVVPTPPSVSRRSSAFLGVGANTYKEKVQVPALLGTPCWPQEH